MTTKTQESPLLDKKMENTFILAYSRQKRLMKKIDAKHITKLMEIIAVKEKNEPLWVRFYFNFLNNVSILDS